MTRSGPGRGSSHASGASSRWRRSSSFRGTMITTGTDSTVIMFCGRCARMPARISPRKRRYVSVPHGSSAARCGRILRSQVMSGATVETARRVMSDYRMIRVGIEPGLPFDRQDTRPIAPRDTLAMHLDHRVWLEAALREPHPAGDAGKTVVITHHGPSPATAVGVIDALTPSFHSNLHSLILETQPNIWFFGHSHRRCQDARRPDRHSKRLPRVSRGAGDPCPGTWAARVFCRRTELRWKLNTSFAPPLCFRYGSA